MPRLGKLTPRGNKPKKGDKLPSKKMQVGVAPKPLSPTVIMTTLDEPRNVVVSWVNPFMDVANVTLKVGAPA